MHRRDAHRLMTGVPVHALVKQLQLLRICYAWAAFLRINSSSIPLPVMCILETTDGQT